MSIAAVCGRGSKTDHHRGFVWFPVFSRLTGEILFVKIFGIDKGVVTAEIPRC